MDPRRTCAWQPEPKVGAEKRWRNPVGGWGLLHIPLEVRPRVGEVRLGQPEPAGHWARPVERRRARSSWVTSWLT